MKSSRFSFVFSSKWSLYRTAWRRLFKSIVLKPTWSREHFCWCEFNTHAHRGGDTHLLPRIELPHTLPRMHKHTPSVWNTTWQLSLISTAVFSPTNFHNTCTIEPTHAWLPLLRMSSDFTCQQWMSWNWLDFFLKYLSCRDGRSNCRVTNLDYMLDHEISLITRLLIRCWCDVRSYYSAPLLTLVLLKINI